MFLPTSSQTLRDVWLARMGSCFVPNSVCPRCRLCRFPRRLFLLAHSTYACRSRPVRRPKLDTYEPPCLQTVGRHDTRGRGTASVRRARRKEKNYSFRKGRPLTPAFAVTSMGVEGGLTRDVESRRPFPPEKRRSSPFLPGSLRFLASQPGLSGAALFESDGSCGRV